MNASVGSGVITHAELARHFRVRAGHVDIACPICGPERKSSVNQRRKVLRIWHVTFTFTTYFCARCGVHGQARDDGAASPDPVALAKARGEARRLATATAEGKQSKARWLWDQRRSLAGSPAERYLRQARSYDGPLPAALGFLPARGNFHPAMISAFGMPNEGAPIGAPSTIPAVHLTRLKRDGSAKAGTDKDKIMIGSPLGVPIALADIGDLLGLAITEGVEDALSVHSATGLGAWAAGAASFMPALAAAVPSWVESVTIMVDDDPAGRRNADELARRLEHRRIEARLVNPVEAGPFA